MNGIQIVTRTRMAALQQQLGTAEAARHEADAAVVSANVANSDLQAQVNYWRGEAGRLRDELAGLSAASTPAAAAAWLRAHVTVEEWINGERLIQLVTAVVEECRAAEAARDEALATAEALRGEAAELARGGPWAAVVAGLAAIDPAAAARTAAAWAGGAS